MPPVLAAIPAIVSAASAVAAEAGSAIAIGASFVAPGVVTAAGATTFITNLAISSALGAAANLLQSHPAAGVQWRTAQGPLETRRIPCGKVYTSGRSMGDAITWGGSRQNAVILNALADVPIGGISTFKVNGSADTFNGVLINGYPAKFRNTDSVKGYEIEETVNPFTGERVDDFLVGKPWKFFVGFHFGEDSQVADEWMVANVPTWDSTAVGKNLAYARAYAFSDWDIFSGLPTFAYYLDGALMYNPAKDSSVGGSGSHRWGTLSTYEVSTNPAVQAYNIARGFFNSAGKMVYGSGYLSEDLPLDFWIPAIQDCDELITDKDGTQSPRYSCSFEIDITEDPRKYLTICETAMAGRICEDRGQLLAYAGVAQTPVFTFSAGDKVQGAPNLYDKYLGLDNLKNIVTGKFLSVAECFVQVDAPPRESDADVAEDGGIPLTDDMDLSMITHGPTAQRVMEVKRQRHRAQATCTRTLRLPAANARKGQWVAGTNPDWEGTKWFEIVKSVPNLYSLVYTLALREVPYNLGEWNPAVDELDRYTVTLRSADPLDPLKATGVTAAPLGDQGGDGSSLPSISVNYTIVNDPSAKQVELQVGKILASGSHGTSNGTTAFTDTVAAAFTAGMVGKIIVIEGAGESGGQYTVTVAAYISATAITLSDATVTIASGCTWMVLDDTQCFYDPDTTSGVIKAGNLLGQTPYAYRVKISGIEGRAASWSDWSTVTTPATVMPGGVVLPDVNKIIGAEFDRLNDILNASESMAQVLLGNEYDKWQIRKTIASESSGNKAYANAALVAAAGAGYSTSGLVIKLLNQSTADGLYATSSALNSITSRVITVEGTLTSQATSIVNLQNSLAAKSDASTVSALQSTVTSQGSTLTSQGSAIVAIQNTINDGSTGLSSKASSSALNSLSSTVTSIAGTVTSQGSALTALQSIVGNISASGYWGAIVSVTGGGATVDVGFGASLTAGGTPSNAAMGVHVDSGGGNYAWAKGGSFKFFTSAGALAWTLNTDGLIETAGLALGSVTSHVPLVYASDTTISWAATEGGYPGTQLKTTISHAAVSSSSVVTVDISIPYEITNSDATSQDFSVVLIVGTGPTSSNYSYDNVFTQVASTSKRCGILNAKFNLTGVPYITSTLYYRVYIYRYATPGTSSVVLKSGGSISVTETKV
jgi:hypothetical protein